VVGSTLWKEGVDIAREMRLIKALADEGYENGPARGRAAVPHSEWVTFATFPGRSASACWTPWRRRHPMIQLRADRAAGSAGPREYELLIPASWEVAAIERFGRAREQALAAAEAGRGPLPGHELSEERLRERRTGRGPRVACDGALPARAEGTDGAPAEVGALVPHGHLGRRNDRLLLAAVASYAVILSVLMIARGISVTPELIVIALAWPRCCSVAASSSCATGYRSWRCSSPTS